MNCSVASHTSALGTDYFYVALRPGGAVLLGWSRSLIASLCFISLLALTSPLLSRSWFFTHHSSRAVSRQRMAHYRVPCSRCLPVPRHQLLPGAVGRVFPTAVFCADLFTEPGSGERRYCHFEVALPSSGREGLSRAASRSMTSGIRGSTWPTHWCLCF